MLLTIDIGNTTVAVGGFLGPELRFVRRLPSDRNMDAAALEGISLRLEEELGPVTVVLTGGHGRDILPLLRRAVEYEPHLQLMGLRELWLRSL